MCKAYSCIVDKNGKVYWKAGLDSHSDIQKQFKLKEPKLHEPPTNEEIAKKIQWAKIEITPKDGNYLRSLNRKDWQFNIDEPIKPIWWNEGFIKPCWDSWVNWKDEIYSKINLKEARNPINPLQIKVKEVTKEDIELLKKWASVRASVWAGVGASVRASVRASVGDSVWASVWDSVRDSVGANVGDSVGDSVGASVGDSVGASVRAYTGSMFLGIDKWKYVDYRKKIFTKGEYPFQSAVTLWKKGLVPSFDGKIWRLHVGKDAKLVWEGKL